MNFTALFLQWPRPWQPLWARTDPYIPWERGEETLNEEETLAGGIVTAIIVPTVCYCSHLNSIFPLNRNNLPSVTCSNSSVWFIYLLTAIFMSAAPLKPLVLISSLRKSALKRTAWSVSSWSENDYVSSTRGAGSRKESWGSEKSCGGSRSSCGMSRTAVPWRGLLTWMAGKNESTYCSFLGEGDPGVTFVLDLFFCSTSEKTTGPINVWLWTTATAAQTFLGRNVIRTLTTGIGAVTRTTWWWTGATALGEWVQTETAR